MTLQIRRATPDDWATVRDVRLAALQDAPYAFGSTYVRERDYDEQRWRAWVGATDDDGVVLLAYDDGRPVGMDGAFHGAAGAVALIAMWVAPAARRIGVGAALTRAVIDWARSVGAAHVLLGIAEDNDRARQLYESLGFRLTGNNEPLHSDPSRLTLEMSLEL